MCRIHVHACNALYTLVFVLFKPLELKMLEKMDCIQLITNRNVSVSAVLPISHAELSFIAASSILLVKGGHCVGDCSFACSIVCLHGDHMYEFVPKKLRERSDT